MRLPSNLTSGRILSSRWLSFASESKSLSFYSLSSTSGSSDVDIQTEDARVSNFLEVIEMANLASDERIIVALREQYLPLAGLVKLIGETSVMTFAELWSDKFNETVGFLASAKAVKAREGDFDPETTLKTEVPRIVLKTSGSSIHGDLGDSRLFVSNDSFVLEDDVLSQTDVLRPNWSNIKTSHLCTPFDYLSKSTTPVGALLRELSSVSSEAHSAKPPSTKPLGLSDIDVVAVTTQRYKNVRELLKSIRAMWGQDIKVHVVIQAPKTLRWSLLGRRFHAILIHTTTDFGLSASRNLGVARCQRELVFLMDDDFQIDERCRLNTALQILNQNQDISVLGGNLLDVGQHKTPRRQEVSQGFAMKLLAKPPNVRWLRLEDSPRERIFHDASTYYETCDIVDNFALFRRRSVFGAGASWSEPLKITAEHQDFYLRLSTMRIGQIARTNALKVRNVRLQNRHFRAIRYRSEFMFRFFDDLGLQSFEIVGERTRKKTVSGDHALIETGKFNPRFEKRSRA